MRLGRYTRPLLATLALLLLIGLGAAATIPSSSSEESSRPTAAEVHARDAEHNAALAADARTWNVTAWVNGYNARQFELYLDAVHANEVAEAEAQAAAARMARAPRAPQGARAPQATGATGACGGATNGADRYIGRESGGVADKWNTQGSGAWGCYQIMPGTWSSSCSDLGQHGSASASAQAQCASRLPQSAWSSSGPVG